MKLTTFFMPWFFSIAPPHAVDHYEPKVIMTNIILEKPDQYVRKRNPQDLDVFIGEKLAQNHGTHLSLKRVFVGIPRDHVVPKYHPLSLFHYLVLYQRYAHKISYNEYCLLEESFARILIQFLHDPRPIHYILYFSDPSWFYDESFLSFLTKEERLLVHRILLIDLDEAFQERNIPCEENIYLWNRFSHPTC